MGINPRNLKLRPGVDPITSTLTMFVIMGSTLFGMYLDIQERNRYLLFRDQSKMFGKGKKEGEEPTWGKEYWNLDKWETLRKK